MSEYQNENTNKYVYMQVLTRSSPHWIDVLTPALLNVSETGVREREKEKGEK
jgi:hypothetical protein